MSNAIDGRVQMSRRSNQAGKPPRIGFLLLVLLAVGSTAGAATETAPRAFVEGRFEKGSLRYFGNVPVLVVEGTPEEIGRQKAELIGEPTRRIADYPRRLLKRIDRESQWPKLLELGEALVPQFPPGIARELKAFAARCGVPREDGIVGNTIADTMRGGFGCSSLMVEPSRSASGRLLFGRNLDYFSLDLLDKYSLVTVVRPQGKHAFASIGFPGLAGCLSGMNDAGLALAVHEVYLAHDGAAMFNPTGVPYTMLFRRILEECATVDAAEQMLRDTPRTTMLSLAICDTQQAAVLEMTPRSVERRGALDGLCVCTNHFRTPPLAVLTYCRRYDTLADAAKWKTISVEQLEAKLDAANQGKMTLQTMIFEPATLGLHLGIGKPPSSKPPLTPLDLKPLLCPVASAAVSPATAPPAMVAPAASAPVVGAPRAESRGSVAPSPALGASGA